MACDVPYLLRRAETEAVRAIASNSEGVAAVHQEMCLLYTGRAIAGLLLAALGGTRTLAAPAGDSLGEGMPA